MNHPTPAYQPDHGMVIPPSLQKYMEDIKKSPERARDLLIRAGIISPLTAPVRKANGLAGSA